MYGRLYTENSPGARPKGSPPAVCPACGEGIAGRAHITLGCRDVAVNAHTTGRHNATGRAFVDEMERGNAGGCLIREDTGRGTLATAQRWTIHAGMVSDGAEAGSWPAAEAHIPDSVLYHTTSAAERVPDASTQQDMIGLEVGYCDEAATADKCYQKLAVYAPAVQRLRLAGGHKLDLRVQALGARVPVVRAEWSTWEDLGIPRERHTVLHRRIWRIAVTYLRAQVVAWRIACAEAHPREGIG